jgi:hypothetical protein
MPLEQVVFGAHRSAPRDWHRRGHGTEGMTSMQDQPTRRTCECGCGEELPAPRRRNDPPRRFIHNHHARLQVRNLERFTVEERGHGTPCWIWQGFIAASGYGQVGRNTLAHRALYEDRIGPIPDGLELDHLCRVTACVNPAHLEPVTRAVNADRTRKRVIGGVCARGHTLTEATAWTERNGKVHCKVCHRDNQRRWREARA